MSVSAIVSLQPISIPAGIALRTKENRPHVVVDTVDLVAVIGEEGNDFAADKSA
jgi:hypothetical protein